MSMDAAALYLRNLVNVFLYMRCISCGDKAHALLPMRNRSYGICKGCNPAIKIDHRKFAQ